MVEARIDAESDEAVTAAVDALLTASGADPVFVYTPDGAVMSATGESAAAALSGDDDLLPGYDAVDDLDLVYEDCRKYRVSLAADDGSYEVRGGFPRTAFDRELATDRYRLRNPDGSCSAFYIANLMEA